MNKFIAETLPQLTTVSDHKTDTSLLTDFIEYYLKRDVKMPLILKNIVENIDGAFNLIIYYGDIVYVVRDSLGMRPLSLAKKNRMICIASESSLYNSTDFTLEREIKPGEILICKPGINMDVNPEYDVITFGFFRYQGKMIDRLASCALEYVYLSNNNSIFNGISIKNARYNFGKQLWCEEDYTFKKYIWDNKQDYIVSYVPKTAYYAAKGYAKECELPLKKILTVNRPGRTFIISNQQERISALYNKFVVNIEEIMNSIEIRNKTKKKLILIDDSIVRGNTLLVVVKKLLATNLFSEIHLRSAAPPVHFEDYMGIDIPTKRELIANQLSVSDPHHLHEKICEFLNVTNVRYLSVKGLRLVLDYLDPEKTGNKWCVFVVERRLSDSV